MAGSKLGWFLQARSPGWYTASKTLPMAAELYQFILTEDFTPCIGVTGKACALGNRNLHPRVLQ